jgi:hypothetical protein
MGNSPVKSEAALQSDGCSRAALLSKRTKGARSCGCSANAAACVVVPGVVQLERNLASRPNPDLRPPQLPSFKRMCLRNDDEERQ